MVSQHIIPYWIASVASSINSPIPEDEIHETPSRKRARLHRDEVSATDTFLLPYNISQTSPGSNTELPLSTARKRDRDGQDQGANDDKDLDFTPEPNPRQPFRGLSNSPTKRQRTSVKSLANLARLEKPVHIVPLSQPPSLPADVRSLHSAIRHAAGHKVGIIPSRVSDNVVKLHGDIPLHSIRQPDQTAVMDSDAERIQTELCRIVDASADSIQGKRLESAWNHYVHTPILNLVFGSSLYDATRDAQKTVVARYEAVMGATIAGEAIPLVQPSTAGEPNFACSVSLNTSVSESDQSTGVEELIRTKVLESYGPPPHHKSTSVSSCCCLLSELLYAPTNTGEVVICPAPSLQEPDVRSGRQTVRESNRLVAGY
ncbi:hypothetical protein O1611_g7589 [Lasiodiplodia mahajangana]|uniref:Uncharacterized protein n=1 Tax=Lasiodiplodia mahajangana TaxID=1108764 RepID=A0ACC2JF17_9PEZI|nr:hypothetical protein O1611_g7589 [Lasiodiplodia mahajangana]